MTISRIGDSSSMRTEQQQHPTYALLVKVPLCMHRYFQRHQRPGATTSPQQGEQTA